MPRTFTSAGTPIDCSVGGCNIDGNDMSVFAIARLTTTGSYRTVVSLQNATSTDVFALGTTPSDTIACQTSTVDGYDATNIAANKLTVNKWYILGWTHVASAVIRVHLLSLEDTAGTWNRESSAGTHNNTDTPSSSGRVRFGQKNSTEKWPGDIECVAVWDRALTDNQVDTLPLGLQAWFAQGPVGLWLFDQSLTTQNVVDWTGNGASQTAITGTSVATSHPPMWNRFGHVPNLIAAAAAAGQPTMRRWGGIPGMTPGARIPGRSW